MSDEEAVRMPEDALISQNWHSEEEMAYAEGLCENEEEEMSVHKMAGLEAARIQLAHGAGGGYPVNAVAAVGTDGELPFLLLGLIHLTASTLADLQASADWQAGPNHRLPD
jgi:hypothetical protein